MRLTGWSGRPTRVHQHRADEQTSNEPEDDPEAEQP